MMTQKEVQARIKAQSVELLGLLKKSNDIINQIRRPTPNRVVHWIRADVEFPQDDSSVKTTTFNIPADCDFEAYRFVAYTEVRRLNIATDNATQSEDDVTWLALPNVASWSAYPGVDTFESYGLDGFMEFSWGADGQKESVQYQNAPFPLAQCYCSPGNTFAQPWISYAPSGLVFDCPLFLERGSTFSARFTPSFLKSATSSGDTRYSYRVSMALEGVKLV